MKRHDMLQILSLFAALMFATADPLAGMDQAIAVIPQRAVRVVQISEQANTIAQTTFNPTVAADFKAKYAALLQTEKDIGAEINNIVGLSGQINGLHQQTLVRKGQEEANINNLNAQIHRMAADVNANEQHLANLNAELANAEAQLADAEHELEKAEKEEEEEKGMEKIFPHSLGATYNRSLQEGSSKATTASGLSNGHKKQGSSGSRSK